MSKLLAVFGATGKQGGSVIDTVLNDPELSKQYTIRAITRDTKSDKAVKLRSQVQVVFGDATQSESLRSALTGVHTVFAMTQPTFDADSFQTEYESAKAIADAAVSQGADYIIFSTLTAIKEISGGKYSKVTNFDAKAAAEKYIKSLPIKSSFILPGEFMENFHEFPAYDLKRQPDDTYLFTRANSPTSKIPLLQSSVDTGKFVGVILASPEEHVGKTMPVATKYYSLNEVAAILSKSTGKKVVYKQLPIEDFADSLPDFLKSLFTEVLAFAEEYGYFGADSESEVAEAAKAADARGKLTTFEEYLASRPLRLE